MAKAIVVLASTLVFACVALLVGWLYVQESRHPTGGRVHNDILLCCYFFAPILGAAIGFGLSVLAMKLSARLGASG